MEEFRKRFAGSQADRIIREEAEAAKIAAQLKKTKVSGYINIYFMNILYYLFNHLLIQLFFY